MSRTIVIGSRESRLAVIQAEYVKEILERTHPELTVQILTMKTTGDRILDRTLEQVGGKGLFVKELDRALRTGKSDLSVHSLKDVPMEVPADLPIAAFSAREDARDALVLPKGAREIDFCKPIGCASKRRTLQIKELYPQAVCQPVRGNVLTRLRKLDEGEYGALVLAAAGLKRLGLSGRISRCFEPEEMVPAAGQGILAIQGREGGDYRFLEAVDDRDARDAALCERAFVGTLNGGCSSPVAAYARVCGEEIQLLGFYYDERDGSQRRGVKRGKRVDAEKIGAELARELL